MNVYINQKEIQIFDGATVRDAVLAYDKKAHEFLLKGKLAVHDRFGNLLENDGELTPNQLITIEPTHSDEIN
ncbi:MAG: hypothetical protein ACOYMF_10000 [Bacteroidales bacterium]